MMSSFDQLLSRTKELLEKSGIESGDRDELLALLEILVTAGEVGREQKVGETPTLTASDIISIQALLSLVKQYTAELNALRRLSLKFTSSLNMSTVLDAIVHESMRLVNNTYAVHIFLYKNKKLEFGAALQADGARNPLAAPRENGLTYTAALGGETIVVENMQDHPLFKNAPMDWNGSIISIPLKMGSDVVGVMNLSRSSIGGFTISEMRLLNLLSDQAAAAISNASLHQQIRNEAYSDTVTGLPNRRALDERLEREFQAARRTGQTFAIVMMDLDGFKDINDTYGHNVGDLVLRAFFNYMTRGLRSTDFLARYGGDELTLIMSQTSLPAALIVGEKIVEQVARFTFTAPDQAIIKLGLSGGIAVYLTHGNTAPDLLRAADEALYRAKRHARGKLLVAKGLTAPLNIPRFPPSS